MNPQQENSQTDKKSENVRRGRRRARPLRSEVTTNQSSIQGSIGVSSAAQEAGMYIEADIHQGKCKLLVDTGATVSIVSNDIYQKIPDVARPTLTTGACYDFDFFSEYSKKTTREESKMSNFHTTLFQNSFVLVS